MNPNSYDKDTFWAVSIIVVCILAGCFLLFKNANKKSDITTPTYDHIISQYATADTTLNDSNTESIDSNSETKTIHPEPEKAFLETDKTSYQCPIDFEALWETNKDVYAWINIPGTIIDYPILQHETDNSYYLNYNIDGTEGFPGCIYTENVNAKDFTDNNTVIYGHNLRSGKMFTDLHKFRDVDFFNAHDTVYIYTPEKQMTYKIFAAYLYDDRHLLNSFDFSDETIFTEYLTDIQDENFQKENFRETITVTGADKIITLITCIREQPEKRVYVQAVLLPDNEVTQNEPAKQRIHLTK